MAASDTLHSIDAKMAEWKNELLGEYDQLKRDYEKAKDQISLLEAQIASEAAKSTTAIRTAATLIAHFGSVSRIFEEAKTIALAAGADAEAIIAKPATEVKTDIDSVVGRVEALLHTGIGTMQTPANAGR